MISRSVRCAAFLSLISLGLPALVGCGTGFSSSAITSAAVVVTGNWQFRSASASAAQLPSFSGELTGTNTTFTGILHSNSASACVSPKSSFAVTGSADARNNLTLTASNFAGGTLKLTGVLAANGKSISNTSYTVTGGSCAFAQPADATSQAYADITGTYTGSFTDPDGDQIAVSAALSQAATPDTNGDFTMTGSGTFAAGNNPCFHSPTPVTSANVSGNQFAVTYTDSQSGAQINIQGTFSPDATSLTLSGVQVAGPCGSASGTGTLTKQP